MTFPGVQSALRVPADLQVVGFVRSAFACLLAREDWPADTAGRVLLASTEALVNAIEHGSPAGASVDVALTVTAAEAELRVVDQGVPGVSTPVCPIAPPPPTATRGRGLIIISRLADDFELRPSGAGTEASIRFLRERAAAREAMAAAPARAA
jgi:anti-sigma regulatory factor (Ser/Thr protein kinase)